MVIIFNGPGQVAFVRGNMSELSNKNIKKISLQKYGQKSDSIYEDCVAQEVPFELRLSHDNGSFETLAITLCSPADCEDLIYGYLFSEHIISQVNDILQIQVFDNELGLIAQVQLHKRINFGKYLHKRQGMVHASCGLCGKTEIDDWLTYNYPKIHKNKVAIKANVIKNLVTHLVKEQGAFRQTGGIHASALFDAAGNLLFLREDIGRHNALDKLVGACLKENLLPLSNKIVLLSGRVSFELVHKALLAGVSALCALGAPSSLSIEIAKLNGMCLYGFVKSDGFNRYC